MKSGILHEIWELFLTENHLVDHKGLVAYEDINPSKHPHVSKEGDVTLKQQSWMSLLTAHRSISPAERIEGTWNQTFCMKSLSCFWHKWHSIYHTMLVNAVRSSSYLPDISNEGYTTLNQSAMYVFPCSTSSHFLCREGAQNLIFCMTFGSCVCLKQHSVDHKGLVDTARRSSKNHHTSKEGYGTTKQQLILLLVSYHPPSSVLRGCHHASNLGAILDRNEVVLTMRSL